MTRKPLRPGLIAALCLVALLSGCVAPGPLSTEKDGGIGGTGVQAE